MATKKAAAEPTPTGVHAVQIKPPNIRTVQFHIEGSTPLVINRFSAKAMQEMIETQQAGSTAKSKRKREAKDFEAAFHGARHISTEGWDGISAAAFRNGMISACRIVGFKMTLAKLSVFVVPDGFDTVDGSPLVRITSGKPERWDSPVRLPTGQIDVHPRPMWRQWTATVTVNFDADQFTPTDVANLMARVGEQVGIGEGRHDSKNSPGLGFGAFRLVNRAETERAA